MADENVIEAPITINIGNICEGVAIDAFELELAKCMANIVDPATSPTAARVITMVWTLTPKEDRVQVVADFKASSKLSTPSLVGASRLFVGSDEEGSLIALKSDPRQMNIFKAPKAKETPQPITFKTKGK